MTFGEFKKLDYNDNLEMEIVLSEAFYKHQINFLAATNAYTYALEKEKHHQSSLFNEASTVITMWLSGNWKKPKDKESLFKRAIHIFNLNKTFPSNIYNKQYGYTDEDKKEWDENMKLNYGIECEEEQK